MYKFKIKVRGKILWLGVIRNGSKRTNWLAYEPREILDLITELETRDEGYYDRT